MVSDQKSTSFLSTHTDTDRHIFMKAKIEMELTDIQSNSYTA